MGFDYYPTEQFLRIVKNHGVEKILFGSDSPWSSAGSEFKHLSKMPLSDEEKVKIAGGNAKNLLCIKADA
jgi:predicted TIM-barrel fold metal-dependent hydrolase